MLGYMTAKEKTAIDPRIMSLDAMMPKVDVTFWPIRYIKDRKMQNGEQGSACKNQ